MASVQRNNVILMNAIVWILLLCFWTLTPATRWFHAFVRSEEMRAPYTVIFFALLGVIFFVLYKLPSKVSIFKSIALGAFLGHISAILSVTLSTLNQENGGSHLLDSFDKFGVLGVLSTNSWIAFLLGGWCMGVIASMSMFMTRISYSKTRHHISRQIQ